MDAFEFIGVSMDTDVEAWKKAIEKPELKQGDMTVPNEIVDAKKVVEYVRDLRLLSANIRIKNKECIT